MIAVKVKKETVSRILIYAMVALFYLWLASCVPYTHDDWDWGISNGITQLLTANINSRYAGNFCVVVMTRSQLLKTVMMGLTCFLVPFGIGKIAAAGSGDQQERDRMLYFLVGNFLLLTMDLETWRETYGWVSGFANYVISAIFLLLHLNVLLQVFEERDSWEKDTTAKAIGLGCTSFLGQLFLENLAIYMVLLVLFVGFIYYKKFHRIPRYVMCMAVGVLAGLAVMFSSSIYGSLLQTGSAVDGVRKMSFHADKSLMENIKGVILQTAGLVRRGGEEQFLLNSILLCLLGYCLQQKKELAKTYKTVLIAINIVIVGYFSVVKVFSVSYDSANLLLAAAGAAVNFLYFLMVTIEIAVVLWNHKLELYKAGVLWGSVILYLAPMIATTVFGPRIYYISNVLTILLVCLLLRYSGIAADKKMGVYLTSAVAVGIAVSMLYYGVVYHAIDTCNQQRLENISKSIALGETEIQLPRYSYEEYLWMPDPISEQREGYYKEFYEIPENFQLSFE